MSYPSLNGETKRHIREIVTKIREGSEEKEFFVTIATDDGVSHVVRIYFDGRISPLASTKDISDDSGFFEMVIRLNPKDLGSDKEIYNRIYHELLHATDPDMTTMKWGKPMMEYDPGRDEMYYGSVLEVRAWMGEIIEALGNEVSERKKRIRTEGGANELKRKTRSLLKILKGQKKLTREAKELLNSMAGENKKTPEYYATMMNFKKYNPDGHGIMVHELEKFCKKVIFSL